MADGAGSGAFLGVARSLSGRAWRQRPADPQAARDLALRLDLSEPMARALAARGVTVETAKDYLEPTLKALFPDPSTFSDMDTAVAVLLDALHADLRVVVFAD